MQLASGALSPPGRKMECGFFVNTCTQRCLCQALGGSHLAFSAAGGEAWDSSWSFGNCLYILGGAPVSAPPPIQLSFNLAESSLVSEEESCPPLSSAWSFRQAMMRPEFMTLSIMKIKGWRPSTRFGILWEASAEWKIGLETLVPSFLRTTCHDP